MEGKITENMLISQFIEIDDFVNMFEPFLQKKMLECADKGKKRNRKTALHMSEIMTILAMYHQSGYKCFQYYYEHQVLKNWRCYFPELVSYGRFVSLIPRSTIYMSAFALSKCWQSPRTGYYYVDSKKLPVCDNLRIHSNKVFKGVAQRGKSSCGWFYGLKLHLVINHLGDIVNFVVSPANVADNNKQLLPVLLQRLQGKCYGDKGYMTTLFEEFLAQGLELITKVRKNMDAKLVEVQDKQRLLKRGVIESVNDLLMTVMDVDHTRHRSPVNAVTHILGGIIAYSFYPDKPHAILERMLTA